MSGHSKWATIKHKKGLADAKRGKIFSKLAKEIMVAARAGGGNPNDNASLRNLMQKARASNMPGDNIDRAIKKGTGELDGGALEEVVYEGYTAGGVALIVKVLTDNRNRAAAEVRHVFTKNGSSFAQQGAVSRTFVRKGQIIVDAAAVAEDKLMDIVIEAGADDMTREGEQFEILTEPSAFDGVCEALTKAGIQPVSSEITLLPSVPMPVADVNVVRTVTRFISGLEELDDVQDVYSNMDVSDEVMAKVGESA